MGTASAGERARVQSFPPVAATDAQVLILGSMPGSRSLEMRQYYAQPRNAFWPIMGSLFDAGPELRYAERLTALKSHRVALWDVLLSCERQGSLDTAICAATVVPNDFVAFFRRHRRIRHVFFNGATAAAMFRRRVLPGLGQPLGGIVYGTLPSTSPAHASLTREQKIRRWSVVKGAVDA